MSAPKFDFSGKVALVTGGTRGLGRAMVDALAATGADLVVAARNEERLAETAAAVEKAGRQVLSVPCNVGDWADGAALVEAAYQHFGKVDVLINNAGMSPVLGKPSDLSEEGFDEIYDVNVKSTWRLSTLIGERMVAAGGGSIVNVSSTAAVLAPAPVAPYAGAKAAVNAITKALARAYGPAVRVNAAMFGPFRTDLTKSFIDSPQYQKHVAINTPLKRVGDPQEVVGGVLYLASDLASFTSGAILTMDGGES